MRLEVFSIRDDKAAAFLPPFFDHNEATAGRAIQEAVNDIRHPFGKHPKDYHMYSLGHFDTTTGLFDLRPNPVLVVSLINLLAAPSIELFGDINPEALSAVAEEALNGGQV